MMIKSENNQLFLKKMRFKFKKQLEKDIFLYEETKEILEKEESSERAKEEILEWLEEIKNIFSLAGIWSKRSERIYQQIRRLIEHQLDVSFYGDRFTRWEKPR